MTLLEEHLALLPNNACVPWSGYRDSEGYGRNGGPLAHRQVYERVIGPIPEGLTIDHLCRNRACVNPQHMEPVSMRINALRGDTIAARKAAQTECIHGHPFDLANTRIDVNGTRRCRACNRNAVRRSRERRLR